MCPALRLRTIYLGRVVARRSRKSADRERGRRGHRRWHHDPGPDPKPTSTALVFAGPAGLDFASDMRKKLAKRAAVEVWKDGCVGPLGGTSMPIDVYIDGNVWNFLFERQIDLAAELPRDEFRIVMTREAEFEVPPIPPEKAGLKAFIEASITRCGIRTDVLFGFYDESLPPDEQRVGGFGVGRWASREEVAFMHQHRTPSRAAKKRKTGLYDQEADISLAARAIHSVVLSLDAKAGPINDAHKRGGKVVFLTDFDGSGMSLREFIERAIAATPSSSPPPPAGA